MNILPICDEQQYIFDVNEAIKSIPMTIAYSMEFLKSFSVEKLSDAVDQCIRTADVFAARCVVKDNCTYIEFMPYQRPDFPVYDFVTKEEFHRFCNQARTTKINNRDKLYYIFIYSITGSHYHICFILNHLIMDGISIILLSEKIQKVLNGNKEEIIWNPYAVYLNNMKNYKESQRYLDDTVYWDNRFLEISKCNDLFSEVITEGEASIGELSFQTTQELKQDLMEFCLKKEMKPYCFIVTILAQFLSEKTHCKRFFIEIPIANRMGTKDKNSLGLYEVTLPFVFDFDKYPTLSDLLDSIQKQSFDYYRHNQFDWNTKIASEQNEIKYGRYIPQLSVSYFCTNKEPTYSLSTLNYHQCETALLPMSIYISDYLDWRTITFHYMYWDNYFTEQEVVELHQKLENLIKNSIVKDGL